MADGDAVAAARELLAGGAGDGDISRYAAYLALKVKNYAVYDVLCRDGYRTAVRREDGAAADPEWVLRYIKWSHDQASLQQQRVMADAERERAEAKRLRIDARKLFLEAAAAMKHADTTSRHMKRDWLPSPALTCIVLACTLHPCSRWTPWMV